VRRTTAVDYNSADEFPYVLDINVFIPTCGNGVLEVGEQCDDGNLTPGDGCDDLCLFERVGETEPNAGPAQPGATPPARGNDFDPALAEGPFSDSVVITGTISPVGDEDGFKLLHAGPDPRQVTARILHPFGPYAECDPSSFDLMLHLVDEDGHVLKTGDTPAEIGCDELRFELPANVARYLHVHEYGDNAVVPTYYLQIEFE
jgi:cysteine-rich repeat protein